MTRQFKTKPTGRPPKYPINRAWIDEICIRLVFQPLADICKLPHIPPIQAVFRWLSKKEPSPSEERPESGENLYDTFREEYGRARTASADVGLEQIQEIERRLLRSGRIANPDWDAAKGKSPDNPKYIMAPGSIDPQTARVLIDSIKWRMGKLNAPRYSEKTNVHLSGGMEVKAPKDQAPDWLKDVTTALAAQVATSTTAPQQDEESGTVH